jgi:hypothetical protein
MAGWRQAVEVALTDEEIEMLAAIARSRSEEASGATCANAPRVP